MRLMQNLKIKILSLSLLFTSYHPPLSSVIYHDIDTKGLLKCSVSSRHQNRILIENGEINKVVTADNFFSIKMEPDSGQVFIYPLIVFEGSSTISVVSENGNIQDIELTLEDKSSEVIVLRDVIDNINTSQNFENTFDLLSNPSKSKSEMIATTVKTLLSGKIPAGYVERHSNSDSEIKSMKSKKGTQIVFESERLFDGPFEKISMLQIKNKTKKPIPIEEDIFSDTDWVFLEENTILAGQSIRAIISRKKND